MRSVLLALRNVFRQKRRTILLAAALAVGVTIITVLESFTAGMAVSLADKVSRLQGGEVFVSGYAASSSGTLISLLRDPGQAIGIADGLEVPYSGVSRRTRSQVSLVFGHREAFLSIEGLSERAENLSGIDLVAGDLDLPEKGGLILLPVDIADRLQVAVGERIIVKTSTATGQENIGDLIVAGTFRQDFTLGQVKGYMDIEDLNSLLNLPAGSVQSLSFRLADPRKQDKVKSALAAAFFQKGLASPTSQPQAAGGSGKGGGPFEKVMGSTMRALGNGMGGSGGASGPRLSDLAPDYVDLQVSDLNDITVQLSDLTDTMDLVGTGLFLVLLVIALMGLSSTFRMVMIERTAEIGALRALGMQRGRVIAMFLAEAMSVTLLGAAAGVLLGFLAMPVLSLFHLSETGPMVLFLRAGRLVFNPDPSKLLLNVLLLLAAGALAVLPQAYTASRMNPAAALSKTT